MFITLGVILRPNNSPNLLPMSSAVVDKAFHNALGLVPKGDDWLQENLLTIENRHKLHYTYPGKECAVQEIFAVDFLAL